MLLDLQDGHMKEFEDIGLDGAPAEDAQQYPQMAQSEIHAGFPSPATDYMTQAIDLNRELVKHPAATFYGRVVGDSMIDDGVEEGDNEKWRLEYMTLQMSYQEKYELGVQDGIELGREQGIEQGIELGKISGTIDTLRQLDFNNEQIVQHIMKQFGLSEEEANKYICL